MQSRGLNHTLGRFHAKFTAYPKDVHEIDSAIAICSFYIVQLVMAKVGASLHVEDSNGHMHDANTWMEKMIGQLTDEDLLRKAKEIHARTAPDEVNPAT